MMRTITVKGIGTVSAKPDYITLSLALEAKDTDYNKAMQIAAERISSLQGAISDIGFEKGTLKTTNFNVQTDYENIKDHTGNYQRVFSGYVCSYRFKLSFDFDSKRLSSVLSAIAASNAKPELSISFTVKNPAQVSEELLISATANATRKAETLCKASRAELGQLLTIEYNWGELNVISPTRYELAEDCLPVMAMSKSYAPEIEPDDIDIHDTATFVWEIK